MPKIILVTSFLFAMSIQHSGATQVVLAANNDAGTVSVVDASTFKVKCTLDVNPDRGEARPEWNLAQRLIKWTINWYAGFKYADDVVLSPDGSELFVSRSSIDDVAAFHLPDMKLLWRTPIKGYRSDHLALSPDGTRLFVSAIVAGVVQVLDWKTGHIVGEFRTGSRPHAIRFTPDGKQVLVGEMTGNGITVADVATLKVIKHLQFSAGVRPFELTRDGQRMYLQLSNFHGFLEYDLHNDKILNTVNLPKTEQEKAYNGNYPKEAAHPILTQLSMGMSNDFAVAIEEGSTTVRVGTAIFGKRT